MENIPKFTVSVGRVPERSLHIAGYSNAFRLKTNALLVTRERWNVLERGSTNRLSGTRIHKMLEINRHSKSPEGQSYEYEAQELIFNDSDE